MLELRIRTGKKVFQPFQFLGIYPREALPQVYQEIGGRSNFNIIALNSKNI